MVQSTFLISYLLHFPWLLWLCFLTIKPECFNCTLPHCWKNISQLFSFNSLNLDAPHLAGLKIIKVSSPFYTPILASTFPYAQFHRHWLIHRGYWIHWFFHLCVIQWTHRGLQAVLSHELSWSPQSWDDFIQMAS